MYDSQTRIQKGAEIMKTTNQTKGNKRYSSSHGLSPACWWQSTQQLPLQSILAYLSLLYVGLPCTCSLDRSPLCGFDDTQGGAGLLKSTFTFQPRYPVLSLSHVLFGEIYIL